MNDSIDIVPNCFFIANFKSLKSFAGPVRNIFFAITPHAKTFLASPIEETSNSQLSSLNLLIISEFGFALIE